MACFSDAANKGRGTCKLVVYASGEVITQELTSVSFSPLNSKPLNVVLSAFSASMGVVCYTESNAGSSKLPGFCKTLAVSYVVTPIGLAQTSASTQYMFSLDSPTTIGMSVL